MAKDPVCAMEIEEDEAAATSEYEGRTYYFCSPVCQEQFDENPKQYAQRAA